MPKAHPRLTNRRLKLTGRLRLTVRALFLIVLFAAPASSNLHAQSAKNLTGKCKVEFLSWNKRGGYGAFARSKNGYCGFSWEHATPASARKDALFSCTAKGKGKGCAVVAELKTLSRYVTAKADCEKADKQAKVDACTILINRKKARGSDLAWLFNERGLAYKHLGHSNLALQDCTSALKADPKYAWAYMNRANLENYAGEYRKALADARLALKVHRKGGDDYREPARKLISDLEAKFKSLKSDSDEEICASALTSAGEGWEKAGSYRIYVEEAAKRSLSLDACRAKQTGLKSTPKNLTTATVLQGMKLAHVCGGALDATKTAWEVRPAFERYAGEARRRGVSVSGCREALGLPPLQKTE